MTPEERQQRRTEALRLSRNRQSQSLLERMAQRAVVRQQQEQVRLAEQRQGRE